MPTFYDFTAKRLDGTDEGLERYRGHVLVVVNTASNCGFTPQYEGLETLQRTFAERRFNVLGFPCNQFGRQEPGDAAAIREFCKHAYSISFPMFAKIEVNGPGAHPLFQFLKMQRPGLFGLQGIKWNFTKFLVSRDGDVVARLAPTVKPEAIKSRVEQLI